VCHKQTCGYSAAEFESAITAVEQDIARHLIGLQRAKRKRRSLLAAQRQRLRYEAEGQIARSAPAAVSADNELTSAGLRTGYVSTRLPSAIA
jgi:hypothetical protein